MRIILLIFATLSINIANAQFVKKTKTINVIPDNAKIMISGVEVATGTYNVNIGKEDYVLLKLTAPGYIEKTVKILKSDKNKSLTFTLEIDEAYTASETSSDLANKPMRISLKEGMSIDEAWKRITYYISNDFPNIEIMDKSAGWIRSTWNIDRFNHYTIRTRIEVKEIPGTVNGTEYKVTLQSEIGNKNCSKDQCFSEWDRVLKKYKKSIEVLLNSLN
ncbi:hypothetical protein LJC53_02920 [Bacteroidales bacterium OttesenSCG-928-C03]|nr:hypothetical protein [Bacteroidales bacterium OttesenSCG-928-C03]MDL2326144.1 hypothetical protein [Bacteroidales bacterium OttesenSCG-928-A14]